MYDEKKLKVIQKSPKAYGMVFELISHYNKTKDELYAKYHTEDEIENAAIDQVYDLIVSVINSVNENDIAKDETGCDVCEW